MLGQLKEGFAQFGIYTSLLSARIGQRRHYTTKVSKKTRIMKKERYRIEKAIAAVIKERGLDYKEISKKTGVVEYRLKWMMEGRRGKELTAQDLLAVCAFLRVDPMQLRKAE